MNTKITIIFDNRSSRSGLKTGWGFSALIETDHTSPVLFDAGNDGMALLHNMEELGIVPENIGTIIISHAHADHTGGLLRILRINNQSTIYLPASIIAIIPERRVVSVSQPLQISKDIFSTGELNGIEQSLVVKTKKGIVVVTGCSHPGVGSILDAASSQGRIYGIIGGLYGFCDFNRLDGIIFNMPVPLHTIQKRTAKSVP